MLAEAFKRENPTGRLHSAAVGFMLSVAPDSNTQIPNEHDPEGGTWGQKNYHSAGNAGRCHCFRLTS